jgi:uncharacterized membrane protein YfcA
MVRLIGWNHVDGTGGAFDYRQCVEHSGPTSGVARERVGLPRRFPQDRRLPAYAPVPCQPSRLLLLFTPQRTFDSAIPWLMLASTLLFALGLRISPILKRAFHVGPVTVTLIQFLVAIYGGYFGGAVGIVMLATWSVFGLTNIHVMNANKTVLGATMNGIAVVLFIIARKIWWPQTLAMLVAAVIGGYIGALSAKRVNQSYVRPVISAIGVAITIAFFLRRH